ncbi:integrin alpha-PS3 isoform X2 [Musca domestica]|uniref:Integrin alpha-PS3 isoform X2 n=1 Tax=Musca domestica TaxID=7370 RepID=A0A1I8M3U3_MUSDO|nr:integrin alpha-PS3 isoform X2 [Musca domestica]
MSSQISPVLCLLLSCLFGSLLTSVHAFNFAPKPQVVIGAPQLKFFQPQVRSSYFGYSLVIRPTSLIIGAPRAQSTLESQRKINETGAVYRCTINGTPQCAPFVFENRGNINIEDSDYTYDSEQRDFQWMGAAMDGGTKDTDKLIVCAPRFITPTVFEYMMHGKCYWINDTLSATPQNVRSISPLRAKIDQIVDDDGERNYYYMLAEQGLSVHVTADNDQFLIGAPGIHKWRGSVIRYRKREYIDEPSLSRRDTSSVSRVARQIRVSYETDIPKPRNFNQASDSYFGYSVDSGYFDSNNPQKLLYVASAPQADEQSGEAYIFDYPSKYKITKHFVFRGKQFGEYFGYAVLAEDINGDNLTDVIVSAPQHTITGSYDDGAIYVFINQGNLYFERKLITSPFHGKGRFGTTLTKLGDINFDGYNDIAVGAPFAGNGSVFVYMGSKRGLREQPTQRLDYPGTEQLTYGSAMFGHGLSKGSDVDDNGYNDFAIGAPNAETVYLYHAYPVVSIKATVSSQTREISHDQTTFPVTICYSIATNSRTVQSQDLALNFVVDPQVKRVRIISTNTNELQFNVTATSTTQCKVVDCNVRYSVSDIFKPIELELHYQLVHAIPDSEVFCTTCAAVDPAEPKISTEKIIFNTGCNTDICVADLQMTARLDRTFILGSSPTFKVSYDVVNRGETAYLPQINITSSNRMLFAKIPSNCKHNVQDSMLLCDLNRGHHMANGTSDTITVIYDTSNISGEKMVLMAKVFSTGNEKTPGDNIASDVITLTEFTEISAVGVPQSKHINLEEVSNSAEIVNVYEIKSNGPSTVSSMQLVFDIPVAYTIPGTTKTIPIIDMNNITMQAMYDSQIKDVSFYLNNTQILMNAVEKMSSFSTQFNTKVITESGSSHFRTVEMHSSGEFTVKEESFGDSILTSLARRRRRREAAALTANKDQYARIAHSKSFELLGEDLKGTLPVNRTIVFNCNDPEMTQCVRAVIPLYDFKRNKPITVTMKYHVDLKEVNEILIEPWEFFVIVIDVDVQKTNDPTGSTLAISKKIEYNIISKHQLYGTPIWAIILAIIGGLLALALITYGMYKAGFFKRAKKEEMDKLVHQAQLSNDGVTETSNLNTEDN